MSKWHFGIYFIYIVCNSIIIIELSGEQWTTRLKCKFIENINYIKKKSQFQQIMNSFLDCLCVLNSVYFKSIIELIICVLGIGNQKCMHFIYFLKWAATKSARCVFYIFWSSRRVTKYAISCETIYNIMIAIIVMSFMGDFYYDNILKRVAIWWNGTWFF